MINSIKMEGNLFQRLSISVTVNVECAMEKMRDGVPTFNLLMYAYHWVIEKKKKHINVLYSLVVDRWATNQQKPTIIMRGIAVKQNNMHKDFLLCSWTTLILSEIVLVTHSNKTTLISSGMLLYLFLLFHGVLTPKLLAQHSSQNMLLSCQLLKRTSRPFLVLETTEVHKTRNQLCICSDSHSHWVHVLSLCSCSSAYVL